MSKVIAPLRETSFFKFLPAGRQVYFFTFEFYYSVRKEFTGLANAAFMAWKLTVIKAITNAKTPATANTHNCILIRNANPCSQLFMIHQVIGDAITNAMKTSNKNSFDNRNKRLFTDAPSTLRIPISFVRWKTL